MAADNEHHDNPVQDYYERKFDPSGKSSDGSGGQPSLYEHEASPGKGKGKATADESRHFKTSGFYDIDRGAGLKQRTLKNLQAAFAGKKKYGWIGGGFVGIILSVVFSILPAYELVQIKELLTQRLGEVSHYVQGERSSKVYRRMYFFREDGAFDGYKEKGLMGFLKNRRSKKLLEDMRLRGFEVEPELTDNGEWTGRIKKISQNGNVLATLEDGLRDRRGALRSVLDNLYPEKSRFWRSSRARLLYARYRLDYLRGGWLADAKAALIKKADNLTVKVFRKVFRKALFGEADAGLGVTVKPVGEQPTDNQEFQNIEEDFKSAEEYADNIKKELLDDGGAVREHATEFTLNDNAGEIIAESTKLKATKIISATNIAGKLDSVCEIKRTMGLIVAAAIIKRSEQLIKFAAMFLSAADSIKSGQASSKVIKAFQQLLHENSKNGKHGLYDSGAYAWATGNRRAKVNPINRDHYSVAGGFTGPLGIAAAGANFSAGSTACAILGNVYAQLGLLALFIIAVVATDGLAISAGAVLTGVAVGVASAFVLNTAKHIAAPWLAEVFLGTLITGDEFGEQYMDALVSGIDAMYAANSANFGMKALTVPEHAYLKLEASKAREQRIANTRLKDRLFSMTNPDSLLFQVTSRGPRSYSDLREELVAYLSNPIAVISNVAGNLALSTSVYAQSVETSSQCEDNLIMKNNIATDPFCNPIYGEVQAGLDINPDDNYKYMLDNGYVDENGNPLGDYAEFVDGCVNNHLNYYKLNNDSGGFEFNDYCLKNDEKTLNFRAFSAYKPITDAIGRELDGSL